MARRRDGNEPIENADNKTEYAAVYVRMSTDMQRYSIDNQLEVISAYAAERDFIIVRQYQDAGKSGLTFEGRSALKKLMADIALDETGFKHILVYDISRWGRFQNADESAFYEYLCSRAGISVHYCAEQFDNDGSIGSNLLKTIKRVMAGEFSRELSNKVFRGQSKIARLGFHVGGIAGFGLERHMTDENRNFKGPLADHQKKSYHSDRVLLKPTLDEKPDIIRTIFRLFTEEKLEIKAIAAYLNENGIAYQNDRKWKARSIYEILNNPRYAGSSVYNRRSGKLKTPVRQNPENEWIVVKNAFEAIVDANIFERAQERFRLAGTRLSKLELESRLRLLLDQDGFLSLENINESMITPNRHVYQGRFGSLTECYRLIGYDPKTRPVAKKQPISVNLFRRDQFDILVSVLKDTGLDVEVLHYGSKLLVNGICTIHFLAIVEIKQVALRTRNWHHEITEFNWSDMKIYSSFTRQKEWLCFHLFDSNELVVGNIVNWGFGPKDRAIQNYRADMSTFPDEVRAKCENMSALIQMI